MIQRIHPVGYIKFDDREEDIIRVKMLESVDKVYEVITAKGAYAYDLRELNSGRGKLYKAHIVCGRGQIRPIFAYEFRPCEFVDFVLFRNFI